MSQIPARRVILNQERKPFCEGQSVISELRSRFNQEFKAEKYSSLLTLLRERCGTTVEFRVAETPIFVPLSLLERMAEEGEALAHSSD